MPTILGANSVRDTGFNVANSYFIGADAKTSVTNTTPTNDKIFTISFWIKIHEFPTSSGDRPIFGYFSDSNNQAYMYLRNDGTLGIFENESGNTKLDFRTTQVLRDSSAFYNIIMAIDTTQSTASNRLKLYINGSQVTTFNAENYPDQNYSSQWNENSLVFHVGGTATNDGNHIKGTFCEFAFIDGQQLDQTSFGEFDEDTPTVFKPISLSTLTFGNNGFLLEFKGTGTSANSSGIGADTSGNDRHHSVTNIAATDQRTDTCTNNFCTFTATDPSASNFTLSEGNLKVSKSGAGAFGLYGTNIMLSKGKWYFEVKFTADAGSDRTRAGVAAYESVTGTSTIQGDFSGVEFTCTTSGRFNIVTSGSNNEIDGFNSYSTGDIIQFALDMDNQRLYIGINGNFFNYSSSNTGGDPASGSGFVTNSTTVLAAPVTPYAGHSVGVSGTSTLEFNFGNPTFSISSGNSDSEGFGNFEFSVPSGYFAICTKNLAEYGG